jgi:hypothetical protein
VTKDSKIPMSDLVAEVIDRHDDMTVGQFVRVLWALKVKAFVALALVLSAVFWAGFRFAESRSTSVESTGGDPKSKSVTPNDVAISLEAAKTDSRSLEEFWSDVREEEKRRQGQTTLAAGGPAYDKDIGRRFTWTGRIDDVTPVQKPSKERLIAVSLAEMIVETSFDEQHGARKSLPATYTMQCLFDASRHYGQLATLKRGDTVTVTGVLINGPALGQCELRLEE